MITGIPTLLSGSDVSDLKFQIDSLLSAELQQLDNLLSDATLASYLLAYDTAIEEAQATIRAADLAQFAEGDDQKPVKKKKPIVKRYEPFEKEETAAEITDGNTVLAGLRFDVPPQEAIDFFNRKRVLPPDEFYRLSGEAKAGAFSIGRVYRLDIIEGFRTELSDALQNGRTTNQTIGRLRSILDGAGHKQLGNNHLETIVRTMMQSAYGVGRRSAQESVSDLLTIWEYSAVGDDRTRPGHMALDGMQFPAGHAFWNKYYPPWDFRCRCTVIATLDKRRGYDPNRPNGRTVVNYDRSGLPTSFNVDGTPGNFKAPTFASIPSKASLEKVLADGAKRALDSRKQK